MVHFECDAVVSAALITRSDPRILEGNIAPVNVLNGMPIDAIKLKRKGAYS
jgi:hypothetical protein